MSNTVKQKLNIPSGWQKIPFGEVASLRKGLTYKSSHYSDEENGLVFLTLKSILRGGGFNTIGIKYYSGKYDSTAVVRVGDLVIANTDITRNAEVVGAPVFVPLISDKPMLISMDLSAIDVNREKISKSFLYYLLQGKKARDFMKSQANGSTVLHLKTSNVPKFEFLLPILPEQKNIAEILSTVDEEIQKTDEIISRTEKLKKGLTQDLFTKGIGHKEFKKTDIGRIPKEWDIVTVKSVTKVITKGTTPTTYGHSFTSEGINFFKIENIDGNGNINLSKCKHISEITHQFLKRSQLLCNDVLFSIAGAIGRIAIIRDEHLPANTNQAIAIIRPTEDINAIYLAKILGSDFAQKQVMDKVVQLAQANINLERLGLILIPLPSLSEQEKITNILSSIEQKITTDKKHKEILTQLKKGLMQDLLSGRVRIINN